MKTRLGVWARRYLPAEALSLIAALFSASAALYVTQNAAAAALAGAWGETAVYYATMLARELPSNHGRLLPTLRNLLLEFGAAEILDSVFIRPGMMYAAGQLFADVRLGVLVGKLAADAIFYVPTITAYELRRRMVA